MSVFNESVLLLTTDEFRHHIVKVVCGSIRLSPRGSTATLTNDLLWFGSVLYQFVAQKLTREAKVALGCWYYKELVKTLKVAQKLTSTIYLCLAVKHVSYLKIRYLEFQNVHLLHTHSRQFKNCLECVCILPNLREAKSNKQRMLNKSFLLLSAILDVFPTISWSRAKR